VNVHDFITARLDEDEEALKLVQQPYRLYIDSDGVISEPLTVESPWDDRQGEYEQIDGEDRLPNRHTYWTLLYDPARVLRETAAKRRVLARHHPSDEYESPLCMACQWDVDCDSPRHDLDAEDAPCPDLLYLASIWSDHPDYDPKWSIA
jgi:hypothetical protein